MVSRSLRASSEVVNSVLPWSKEYNNKIEPSLEEWAEMDVVSANNMFSNAIIGERGDNDEVGDAVWTKVKQSESSF